MKRRLALALLGSLACAGRAQADELSGADKVRVLYATQFSFTREGLPLVTVGLLEGAQEVRIRGALRVLPDGEMGAEVVSGQDFVVQKVGGSTRAERRYHVVVSRAPAAAAERLQEEARAWRQRGFAPRTFEQGTVFGIRGEVLDARQLQLTVAPHDDEEAARTEARAIAERYHIETSVHAELTSRPRATIQARDERGVVVRNDGVLWFAPVAARDTLRVDPPGRSYGGQIYVTADRNGALAVVNAVAEDRLLAGLIPAEMNPSAPLEALKAQAVAARNQLLAKLGARHLSDPFRLCAQTHCQVYAGAGQESPRASQAAQATRGELLVAGAVGAEALVDTVYSSSCGGHGEDNDQAWGTRPDAVLRGRLDVPEAPALPRALQVFTGRIAEERVADFLRMAGRVGASDVPLCGRLRESQASFRWDSQVSADTVRERVGPIGALQEVTVLSRGVSGRVTGLRLRGSSASREIHGELEVRRALGGLRSALITLTPVRANGEITALSIRGGGHGHGVGLCQYGAMAQAGEGADYRAILSRYYPGARLRRYY